MRTKNTIDLLSRCYTKENNILREAELGLVNYPRERIKESKKIVDHINKIVQLLSEDDGFIIQNEVIKGKKGRWYQDYMSEATYYRHRRHAYRSFLRIL